MLRLRTEIERVPLRQPIGCREGILLLGSCFTDHIGTWLQEHWLPVMSNPWGVLFNPASIALSLGRVLSRPSAYAEGTTEERAQGAESDARVTMHDAQFPLHELGGRYYSFAHHGRFSDTDPERLQLQLQQLDLDVARFVREECRHLIVTFGTSWVYEREGQVVANCHKFPASDFIRRRLSVQEIVDLWAPLIQDAESSAPFHFVFTVSPIRHTHDTLHGNQLSKATLLLAIDELQRLYPDRVEYLPVYELLNDDLRDYRFYADDLVHPSSLAVEAVRELVSDTCFTPQLRQYMSEADPIVRALQHRPSDPDSPQYQCFLHDTLQRKDALLAKY